MSSPSHGSDEDSGISSKHDCVNTTKGAAIERLRKENEQLRMKEQLRTEKEQLRKENEQLRKEKEHLLTLIQNAEVKMEKMQAHFQWFDEKFREIRARAGF